MSLAQPSPPGVRLDPSRWLGLAATPTFAGMALATALAGDGPMDAMCGHGGPLGGMVPMYLLMSAFHLPPWLRLAGSINLSLSLRR